MLYIIFMPLHYVSTNGVFPQEKVYNAILYLYINFFSYKGFVFRRRRTYSIQKYFLPNSIKGENSKSSIVSVNLLHPIYSNLQGVSESRRQLLLLQLYSYKLLSTGGQTAYNKQSDHGYLGCQYSVSPVRTVNFRKSQNGDPQQVSENHGRACRSFEKTCYHEPGASAGKFLRCARTTRHTTPMLTTELHCVGKFAKLRKFPAWNLYSHCSSFRECEIP